MLKHILVFPIWQHTCNGIWCIIIMMARLGFHHHILICHLYTTLLVEWLTRALCNCMVSAICIPDWAYCYLIWWGFLLHTGNEVYVKLSYINRPLRYYYASFSCCLFKLNLFNMIKWFATWLYSQKLGFKACAINHQFSPVINIISRKSYR